MPNKNSKVLEWLNNVHYDEHGQMIFSNDSFGEDGLQLVADIRGWGAIQHLFDTEKDAIDFQDKVGLFIAQAINEKVKREKHGNEPK